MRSRSALSVGEMAARRCVGGLGPLSKHQSHSAPFLIALPFKPLRQPSRVSFFSTTAQRRSDSQGDSEKPAASTKPSPSLPPRPPPLPKEATSGAGSKPTSKAPRTPTPPPIDYAGLIARDVASLLAKQGGASGSSTSTSTIGSQYSLLTPTYSYHRPPALPQLPLRPRLGRTVNVTPRVDVATAFRVLRGEVSRTGVARDARMQKFHERPGLRRKRLRGERWRKAFNEGFYAVLERVRELRRQGW